MGTRSPPLPPIDRTPKLFIGGKQARPDSGYSRSCTPPTASAIGEVGDGNRKDIRNAVEAARRRSPAGPAATTYNRAQILYYLAENLSVRANEFNARLQHVLGVSPTDAAAEVEASIERLFTFAAWADKFEGSVHQPPLRGAALAVPEPIGVVGVACPMASPLLGLDLAGRATGGHGQHRRRHPLRSPPTVRHRPVPGPRNQRRPAGVINIITGARDPLAQVLAEHDDVDALWYVGSPTAATPSKSASIGNMKRTWTHLESEFSPPRPARRRSAPRSDPGQEHLDPLWGMGVECRAGGSRRGRCAR